MAWNPRNPDGTPNFKTLDDRPADKLGADTYAAAAITPDNITAGTITAASLTLAPFGEIERGYWRFDIPGRRPGWWRRFWMWFLLGARWQDR